MNNYSSARVGIVGFRGYSGAELVRILARHGSAEAVLLEHRTDVPDAPRPRHSKSLPVIPATIEEMRSAQLSLVFLATPPEVSIDLAPALLEAGLKVVDLSGAFRLGDAEAYARWYRQPHGAAALFSQAVYGLPEFYRDQIRGASLVANPGCYPTAVNLALRPLVDAGVVDRSCGVICDAKSGVSGAGRKPSLKTSFSEANENFSAYGFRDHRHVPEVLRTSGLAESELTFTAQLLPLHRGILETIYFRSLQIKTAPELLAIYERQYSNEPFVRIYEPGQLPDLRAVQHTNFCDIGFRFDDQTRRVLVVATVDNLVKGAAGQAVQNMNLMLGFPESEALL